jgi:hypothetical protein
VDIPVLEQIALDVERWQGHRFRRQHPCLCSFRVREQRRHHAHDRVHDAVDSDAPPGDVRIGGELL